MSMYKESEGQTHWQSLYHDFIFDLYDFCKELCDYLTEFDFKDFEGFDEKAFLESLTMPSMKLKKKNFFLHFWLYCIDHDDQYQKIVSTDMCKISQ